MSRYPITICSFGEEAVLIKWPDKVDEDILHDILQFAHHLKLVCPEEKDLELVPAYNSLALISRAAPLDFNKWNRELHEYYGQHKVTAPAERYLWKLPVCYDPEFGIDLELISRQLKLSIPEIISLHTSHVYTVFGIGYLPGFMYLGGLPHSLETQRKSTPRLKVEEGSVGLAGKQTGIYPQESPGGWNIIGNCPIPIFNVEKDPPTFVNVGDRLQFYTIRKSEHELHKIQAEVGIYTIDKIKINA